MNGNNNDTIIHVPSGQNEYLFFFLAGGMSFSPRAASAERTQWEDGSRSPKYWLFWSTVHSPLRWLNTMCPDIRSSVSRYSRQLSFFTPSFLTGAGEGVNGKNLGPLAQLRGSCST